ncbi:MAG: hypothetical protein H0V00_19995 [Chloroflexia bacterium]|nr:hypothetical protein [Chloroflexia bacterium]
MALWHEYRTPGWRGWLLPLTLAGTAAVQTRVLSGYTDWVPLVQPAVVMLSLVAVVGLVAVRLVPRPRGGRYPYPLAAAGIGIVALLLAPSLWAASAMWYSMETRTPAAGPQAKRDRAASSHFVRDADPLLEYLQTNRGAATYLVASADRDFARYAILNTDDPVIAFGGFSGRDPVLSNERLVSLVDTGAVRYFLVESSSGKKNSVGSWIIRNCELLPKITWQPRTAARKKDANGMDQVLFDCGRSRES